ncbi:MAG: hypothetical protein WC717_06105 [Candidatus Micrarchaeia archaeon]
MRRVALGTMLFAAGMLASPSAASPFIFTRPLAENSISAWARRPDARLESGCLVFNVGKERYSVSMKERLVVAAGFEASERDALLRVESPVKTNGLGKGNNRLDAIYYIFENGALGIYFKNGKPLYALALRSQYPMSLEKGMRAFAKNGSFAIATQGSLLLFRPDRAGEFLLGKPCAGGRFFSTGKNGSMGETMEFAAPGLGTAVLDTKGFFYRLTPKK